MTDLRSERRTVSLAIEMLEIPAEDRA